MSNRTLPCVNTIQFGRSPFNSSPQCKKSSLRHHFRRNSRKLFVKEWMKALDKTKILAPSDYFYHFSFPRYGRLKSKFLCERYSHCIFSSCSIDLTKTRYTWSLTAVLYNGTGRGDIIIKSHKHSRVMQLLLRMPLLSILLSYV